MNKKVLIINTGGTLSSVAKEHGLTPGLTTDSMLRELHVVAGEAELITQEFSSLDSANIFPEDWVRLAQVISQQRDDYDGMVVIHGTDTLAYTSSMLSFMLQNIHIPIVITGSQLSISNPVADAMENLRCAIYMAQSGCPGVFVAFNRKVMLGCRTSKYACAAAEKRYFPFTGSILSGCGCDQALSGDSQGSAPHVCGKRLQSIFH